MKQLIYNTMATTQFVFRLYDVNEDLTELPELDNPESERLRTFVQWLNGQKPFPAPIKIIRLVSYFCPCLTFGGGGGNWSYYLPWTSVGLVPLEHAYMHLYLCPINNLSWLPAFLSRVSSTTFALSISSTMLSLSHSLSQALNICGPWSDQVEYLAAASQ